MRVLSFLPELSDNLVDELGREVWVKDRDSLRSLETAPVRVPVSGWHC